jgi:hypothetical protein
LYFFQRFGNTTVAIFTLKMKAATFAEMLKDTSLKRATGIFTETLESLQHLRSV